MKFKGVTLEDAGVKPDKNTIITEKTEPSKEIRYPSLYVDDKELPAIKGKDCRDV